MAYDGRAFGGTHFLKFSFHMFGYLDFLLLIALLQSFFFSLVFYLARQAGFLSQSPRISVCRPCQTSVWKEIPKAFFFPFLVHIFYISSSLFFPGGHLPFFILFLNDVTRYTML